MALIEIQFNSNLLELNTSLYVIKPNAFKDNKDLKVLYLLHGYSGDYTNWVKYSNILKYVEGENLLVVMPNAYNGFYIDNESTGQYFSFLTEEVYNLIDKTFNINQTRENTFIAGLSMGGYGALKAGLTYPDRYSKAVSFSGVMDLDNMLKISNSPRKEKLETIFTKEIQEQDNLYKLSEKSINKIPLYITCGTEDFLYKDNNKFHKHLKDIGYKHLYLTSSGIHNWKYWDEQIEKALKWLLKNWNLRL